VILYAYDILLLSPSVSQLEKLLRVCKRELTWLDMAINFKKLCCIRIGPGSNKTIGTLYSETIPWVTEMRYFAIYFVQSRKLKCSLDAAKRGFYRAANSKLIFSKIGRTASEEVILQIISSKCMPIRFRDSALTVKSDTFS